MNDRGDYDHILLRAVPRPCRRALDVGCGDGRFAHRLAEIAGEVDALDRVDLGARPRSNLRFIEADFMRHALEPGCYDFVSSIASVHHMPFVEGIERMKRALRPGGVLGIIGLFRDATLIDFLWSAAAFPISRYDRWTHRRRRTPPPLREPSMTLREVRDAAERILPGAAFKRRLFWRYTVIWRNDPEQVSDRFPREQLVATNGHGRRSAP
jgi:SAM-dependent methyltransferase